MHKTVTHYNGFTRTAFRSLTFTPALPKSAERANAVLNADKHKIRGDRINLSPLIYARRDCLDLFALNVSACFASKNLRSFRKSTPHSAHRSLEHASAYALCGSHLAQTQIKRDRFIPISFYLRPARFERATLCLEGRCSIQLSYGRISVVVLDLLHAHRVSFSALRACQLNLFAIRHECRPQIRYLIVKFSFFCRPDLPLIRRLLYPAELPGLLYAKHTRCSLIPIIVT